jgi:hypothetical protein
MKLPALSIAVLSAVVTLAAGEAVAADPPIAVGEVSVPESTPADAAGVRSAAEGELRQIDSSRIPGRRRFVVSLALTRDAVEGPVACTVNAMLRDARTGVMIAIIEAGARAEGPVSPELRKQVAHAAVRNAVRRIPRALGAK